MTVMLYIAKLIMTADVYKYTNFSFQEGKLEQDRQCTYNITLRSFRVSIFSVQKQVLHKLGSCLQPQLSCMQSACAELHCHLCPIRLYRISSKYLVNGTFSKEILNIIYIVIFSTFLSETCLIQIRIQRYFIINLHRSSCKILIILIGLYRT